MPTHDFATEFELRGRPGMLRGEKAAVRRFDGGEGVPTLDLQMTQNLSGEDYTGGAADGSKPQLHCSPASLPRPFILARAVMAPYCFIIWRICRYCLTTELTSWTEVPLPAAMRLRRLPSMTLWSRRSWLVMELMMASTCFSLPSSTLASLGKFCSGPILGSMSTSCSSGPILRICFS